MAAEGAVWRSTFKTPRTGFNGAAAGWPRKDGKRSTAEEIAGMLQWGRGRMAAEGARGLSGGAYRPRASMGPRPDGRGRLAREPGHPRRGIASMGPRPDGRGRGLSELGARWRGSASMGPRPDGRGRLISRPCLDFYFPLQWGRGRMAAEGAAPRPPAACLAVLQWGRGRMAAEGRARACTVPPSAALQWGRGRMAAEGRYCSPECRKHAQLQWGRGRMAAEGRGGRVVLGGIAAGFNGAAAGWPRKVASQQTDSWSSKIASMGPRPDGRGRSAGLRRPCPACPASMGPRPDGRGRRRPVCA